MKSKGMPELPPIHPTDTMTPGMSGITLSITVQPGGKLTVSGPIDDVPFTLFILGSAMVQLASYHKEKQGLVKIPEAKVVVAP